MLTLLESLLPAVMAGFLLVRVEVRDNSRLRHLRRVAWTAKGSVRMRRAFLGSDCRLHRGSMSPSIRSRAGAANTSRVTDSSRTPLPRFQTVLRWSG